MLHSSSTVEGRKRPLLTLSNTKRRVRRAVPIRIPTDGSEVRKELALPQSWSPMKRFFNALLSCRPREYFVSQQSAEAASDQWRSICERLQLPSLTVPVDPVAVDRDYFFNSRAALVLEEARTIIAQELEITWQSRDIITALRNKGSTMTAEILPCNIPNQRNYRDNEKKENTLTFTKDGAFTKNELAEIRPGSIFQCIPCNIGRPQMHNICLGVIISVQNEKPSFVLHFFRDDTFPNELHAVKFYVVPVCTLITQFRMYEAMTLSAVNCPLMEEMLGCCVRKTDISASKSNNNKKEVNPRKLVSGVSLNLQKLNKRQEKAAAQFLDSKEGSITLVQGPPGTGKTTLLVSVICQYLNKHQTDNRSGRKRLLVCAPTNKAITVIATKFLSALNESTGCKFIPLLIGDEAKLLQNEDNAAGVESHQNLANNTLKDMYLYSWIENMITSYKKMQRLIKKTVTGKSIEDIELIASRLECKIKCCTNLPEAVFDVAHELKLTIQKVREGKINACIVVQKIDELLSVLRQAKVEDHYSSILAAADVIFCTLCTSGCLLFKQSNLRIHDLIIDEAAATTEPELCIPFHLQPQRLLAVGDPMQLPATLKSSHAIKFGLSRSLHQRLMNDCNRDFILLDKQYRMDPQIALFPNENFYHSKIKDSKRVTKIGRLSGPKLLDLRPYRFIQVHGKEQSDQNKSYYNTAEAEQVVALLLELRNRSSTTPNTSGRNNTSWYSADRIRVITFYQGQVQLIMRMIKSARIDQNIDVSTVDAAQGCEADIVLISFVRSRLDDIGPQSVGFLEDCRRINVALTRARHQVICVGNIHRFEKMKCAKTMKALCANAIERQAVIYR